METIRPSDWLAQFRSTVSSQNGEDGVIEKVFEIIGAQNKWCVEFGAGSGKKDNNTWSLINNHGWSAVLIEGDRAVARELSRNYETLDRVHCLRAYVSDQGKYSLDVLLSQTPIPCDFDFLSIDIDGHDYHVWDALRNYAPRAVMIEFNPKIPLDIEFAQPRNYDIPAGSSLAALAQLAKSKGYELMYAFASNALFVKRELFSQFGISDNRPEAVLINPRPERRWFEAADGSIVLLDSDRGRLLARRKKIRHSAVWAVDGDQLYPVKFRRDLKVFRILKNVVKGSFLYPFIYPLVMKVYGLAEYKRKK